MEGFVLKGNICHSPTPKEMQSCERGYVVCIDGKSQGVFAELPREYGDLPMIDFGDRLILPGLVDLHIHAPQYGFRGTGMDMELMDWLDSQAFPEEAKYADLDYAKKAYSIFSEQLKKSATTRVCMFGTQHRLATELLMGLMEETGLVSYVGKVNMDREAPDNLREAGAEASAEATIAWIESVSKKFQHTKPILTPRFIPSCTDELMQKLREIQMTYGLPVQSHLSENQGEIAFVHELRPKNKFYGDAYDEHDLFGRNKENQKEVRTIMAHCVWCPEEEVELMKKNGVFVAHCPASNMNLSSGIAPIRRYLELGLRIGLGSDVAGGHCESILRAITDTVQVSKLYWRLVDQSASPVTFPEAFYLATKGGGAFFGNVGSFEKGYDFDAVVLDDSNQPYPMKLNPQQRLERAAYLLLDGQGVEAKFVEGRRLF